MGFLNLRAYLTVAQVPERRRSGPLGTAYSRSQASTIALLRSKYGFSGMDRGTVNAIP
jgi:hypothetical protein